MPILELTESVEKLAKSLTKPNAVPSTAEEDAPHIAVASLKGMEFLLTWNFSHIDNTFKKSSIVRASEGDGFEPPEICSPEELLGN
jgi:hypothetical protein